MKTPLLGDNWHKYHETTHIPLSGLFTDTVFDIAGEHLGS
jgi:hypothetical protein